MDLSKFPTKQLLAALKRARVQCLYDWEINKTTQIKRFDKGGVAIVLTVSDDELREELNKREHIPNREESKRKRKILAHKYRKHVK